MSTTMILLHIAGYVALLLWGIRMVETGIVQAYGSELRHFLSTAIRNRWKAFMAGLGITALLQSSTATGLMTASFLASGVMELVPALAVVLGANVGTTLIVQVLTFDIAIIAPILFLCGFIAYNRGGKTRTRDLGRVGIGVGIILLALHLIVATIGPIENSGPTRELFSTITGDPVINVILAALLTWASYSSVAVVLLVMSLSAAHIVTPAAALALVLGANLGNVIPQFFGNSQSGGARRLALGNLIVRGLGAIAMLPFLPRIAELLAKFESNPAREAADFHTLFNVVLAVVFIGLLDPLAKLCIKLVPAKSITDDPGTPRYISSAELQTPSVALASAAREVLRMVDVIERMLKAFLAAIKDDDRKQIDEIAQMDDTVDELHNALKLYLTEISRNEKLPESEARRCDDILAFTINLEHVGDILEKSLSELAEKKIKNHLTFSAEGFGEISNMLQQVLENLRLAVSVFMTSNLRDARDLMRAKTAMRDLEWTATQNHLHRLRAKRAESVETSSLHIDIVRDLKRITAHIASVAYPVLAENGALLPSRLLDKEDEAFIPIATHKAD
jgi:phosphate:Na+ symporter